MNALLLGCRPRIVWFPLITASTAREIISSGVWHLAVFLTKVRDSNAVMMRVLLHVFNIVLFCKILHLTRGSRYTFLFFLIISLLVGVTYTMLLL